MKVLYIIHSLGVGGSETIAASYLIALKRKGINVSLIEIAHNDSYLYNLLRNLDVPVISLFNGASGDSLIKKGIRGIKIKLLQRWKMKKAIAAVCPDVVHFHTNLNYMDRLNIEYNQSFYTFHTAVWRTINYPTRRFKTALKNSCQKGLGIIAISEDIKKEAMSKVGNCKINVIVNGIDIDDISKNAVDKNDFCQEYHIPVDAFILGHVGRYHPVKNHEKVIDIFKEVHKRNPNSYLILIGDGEENRIKKIQERANSYGLMDYVLPLGLRKDASYLMAAFDCFILPSRTEGFPLVLVEAQVHGVRCIATDQVPDEAIINDNCFKLSIRESDEKWAEYVLGTKLTQRGKSLNDVNIENIICSHIHLYNTSLEKE